ncbi:M23 family metallopeptidase [Anaerosoma tenue]|uniref:M23 family metallopeptidase n=1 Tax=Anaerosoma tenue TaxID=2933588 RepID=UPI002260F28D|nr:M23 family metallopeptidase [Anaerosoma tenue]MCK8115927.1 M23 family metallopeptidase [Anaerosoma tenue]
MFHRRVLAVAVLLVLFCAAYAQASDGCRTQPFDDTSRVDEYAADESLPFRFPMDELFAESSEYQARFREWAGPTDDLKYHAAEDYHQPAGTPVYASADGKVSFSGRMGGYGWLIIVDHPQFDLYSLYGHLSPSRWRIDAGTEVEKGELLAYLGDEDENGGSTDSPLVTHLHFGMRVGQRGDYPGKGEWRWMAGWIKPCPTDLGWLRPSEVINAQGAPVGGFPTPHGGFWEVWRAEIVLLSIYVVSGCMWLFFGTRQRKRIMLVLGGLMLIVVGSFFHIRGMKAGAGLLLFALAYATIVGVWFARQRGSGEQVRGGASGFDSSGSQP